MRSVIAIKLLPFFNFFSERGNNLYSFLSAHLQAFKSVLKVSSLKRKIIDVYSEWEKSWFKDAEYKSLFNIYL